MLILNWVFILNGKMHGEVLHFNNRLFIMAVTVFY